MYSDSEHVARFSSLKFVERLHQIKCHNVLTEMPFFFTNLTLRFCYIVSTFQNDVEPVFVSSY